MTDQPYLDSLNTLLVAANNYAEITKECEAKPAELDARVIIDLLGRQNKAILELLNAARNYKETLVKLCLLD